MNNRREFDQNEIINKEYEKDLEEVYGTLTMSAQELIQKYGRKKVFNLKDEEDLNEDI